MRTLVLSDPHGCYELLVNVLKKANYNPAKDQLIMLGDYIDRGPESKKVVELVMELVAGGAIGLIGNHEKLLLAAHDDPDEFELWAINGGREALRSYGLNPFNHKSVRDIPAEHIKFLAGLPLYHETEDYIFVHAGLNPKTCRPETTNPHDMLWIREKWLYAPYRGKTVVSGHTPTIKIPGHQKTEIWPDQGKLVIDTGAFFTGVLTVVQLPFHSYQVAAGE